jgi:putative membrane-bound dehydrogenase-like protein
LKFGILPLLTTRIALSLAAACFVASTVRAEILVPPDRPVTPPQAALQMMHLPPHFKATLFAAEPDVQNPIAMCWDERGRLWVAENYTYSDQQERFDLNRHDRILIFEDSDHDGCFDKRTVFIEGLQRLTSIERGCGGVYALCPPHLIFIPTQDDRPTGPPQIRLDGFNTDVGLRHCIANGLKWGPDGWLYGRIGITSTSWIGAPGTPTEGRAATAGGIWRYHPQRNVVETYCHGTTNPWGMDWNEQGDLFFINTVIGHLWHGIPGAHFKRMMGEDLSPHTYELIDQHADHYHWDTGKKWNETRDSLGLTDSLGGGHAHVGLTIYQGLNFPPQYRGRAFMTNLHGRRINIDRLDPQGSGYVGKHESDFMTTDDPWFRPVDLSCGPDGGIYILDWSDIGECHENDGVHRTSGRIYKITYDSPENPAASDLTKLDDASLLNLQLSDNEWLVRMARWELRERQYRGMLSPAGMPHLSPLELSSLSSKQQLNQWRTCKWLGIFPSENPLSNTDSEIPLATRMSLSLLDGTPEFMARWFGPSSAATPTLTAVTAAEKSSSLRLQWASLLQRLPAQARINAARGLLTHGEDQSDHNLPLMIWYGICDLPPTELAKLLADCRIPLIRQFSARRAAEVMETAPDALNKMLALDGEGLHRDILQGMAMALKGWKKATKPAAWDDFVSRVGIHSEDSDLLRPLEVIFGSRPAVEEMNRIARSTNTPLEQRRSALSALIEAKPPDLQALCEALLADDSLRLLAMQGLATFEDPKLAEKIITLYPILAENERPRAIEVLASRPSFAKVLLRHIDSEIPRRHISPVTARQIRSFGDSALTQQLVDAWGETHESDADKQTLIASLKAKLTPEFIAKGDPKQGRVLFSNSCAACHKLYGEGNTIGPDLTGSGRHEIDYLIENIADPSATVAADYRLVILTLKDGRVLNGTISAKTERTLTVKTMGSVTTVERSDILRQEQLASSIMPEGLLTALDDPQIRNLVSYLMSHEQVSLPPTH